MEKKSRGQLSGGVVIALIVALGFVILVGLLSAGDGGRMNVPFSEEARDCQASEARMERLETLLRKHLKTVDGAWNIYIKDLRHGLTLTIDDKPTYAASLIKLYAMESTYGHWNQVLKNAAAMYGDKEAKATVYRLLENMITVSDNESFNELVRLHSANHSFTEGAKTINKYLEKQGYSDTKIVHTLIPSASPLESISANVEAVNTTDCIDCGRLLERIYNKDCVSIAASEAMLALLSKQEINGKIPAGTTMADKIANKTGETDKEQHDVAIVYTKDRDYILCIMTSKLTSNDEEAGIINVKGVASLVEKILIENK